MTELRSDVGSLSQNDSGTALGDRRYRPDVEGLRAVAVGAVVLFHAGVPGFSGGFVGVDVFFVISGFVITGLLLRKRESVTSFELKDFYARRARRILPAAGLVLMATVLASYHWLGFIRGAEVADDARWCAVFLGNWHFLLTGTNYFTGQLPPSPLQNFWSLGVEEQFYVIYPCALFLSFAAMPRFSLRHRVMVFTAVVVIGSLSWCIYETSVNPSGAYFSSLSRAWELGVGGFVAAGTHYWLRIRSNLGSCLTWVGLIAIALAVTLFTTATPFPGWAAMLPVFGAAFVIVGGTSAGPLGVELLLGTLVFRWIGKLSYSLYLWSWPVLTIAMQSSAKSLTVTQRILTVGASLLLSGVTYAVVENPIRHSSFLAKSWWKSLFVGFTIIIAVLLVAFLEIHSLHTI